MVRKYITEGKKRYKVKKSTRKNKQYMVEVPESSRITPNKASRQMWNCK